MRTILATAVVVVLTYLTAQLIYQIRDIQLIVLVAGFIALVLNPLVVALHRWRLKRGQAVAVVTLVAVILFIALAVAFGYPLVNGLTHLADRLPTYIRQAEHGKGWINVGRLEQADAVVVPQSLDVQVSSPGEVTDRQ